jgi:hypothetical protein
VGRKTSRNFEVVESNKRSGGTLWVSGDYGYVKNKTKDGRIYLACRLNKQIGCKGRAYIDTDECVLNKTADHSCGSSIDYSRGYKTRRKKGSKMHFVPLPTTSVVGPENAHSDVEIE